MTRALKKALSQLSSHRLTRHLDTAFAIDASNPSDHSNCPALVSKKPWPSAEGDYICDFVYFDVLESRLNTIPFKIDNVGQFFYNSAVNREKHYFGELDLLLAAIFKQLCLEKRIDPSTEAFADQKDNKPSVQPPQTNSIEQHSKPHKTPAVQTKAYRAAPMKESVYDGAHFPAENSDWSSTANYDNWKFYSNPDLISPDPLTAGKSTPWYKRGYKKAILGFGLIAVAACALLIPPVSAALVLSMGWLSLGVGSAVTTGVGLYLIGSGINAECKSYHHAENDFNPSSDGAIDYNPYYATEFNESTSHSKKADKNHYGPFFWNRKTQERHSGIPPSSPGPFYNGV